MADARLQFLNASAHHYAITAPATAAHLMLQHAQVAEDIGLQYRKDRPSDTCRACGTITVADLIAENSMTEMEVAEWQAKASLAPPSTLEALPLGVSILETKCAACHRITRKPASRLGAAGRNGPRKQQAITAAIPQPDALTSEGPPNKGPRQRPKARKRGGLQAIVERSRTSRDTILASGLDLMDLMKAG